MRTLVVAPQPFFSYRGTPFSVYYRTLISAELGLTCDLLTYGQGMDVGLPGSRIYRIPAMRWLGDVRVGPSLLKLFLDTLMVLWTIALLCRRRYRVVHAHEEAVFWCMLLKPLFRFRLVYDMHSSLPQQLANFNYTHSSIIRRIFERLERRAVRTAEGIITVCPALLLHARTLTENHQKVFLIENSIVEPIKGEESAEPSKSERVGAEAGRRWLAEHDAGRTLIYAGTLEAYQGIDRLLKAFSLVVRTLPEASLLVVGGQPRQVETYRQQATELGIETHVFFTGRLTHPDTQELLRLCAIAVSPRESGNNTPMKIYEIIASRVPLVATRIESHTQVLADDLCTLTGVEPEQLGEGITWALCNPESIQDKALRAEEWYRRNYSRERYAFKLRTMFALVAA
jgi:glycosyltransferase involved in cell wall biosynthesis